MTQKFIDRVTIISNILGDTVVVSDVPSRKMPADCVLMGEFIYNEASIGLLCDRQ